MAIVEWCVLTGPAILRVSVLLLIAGALAALVQFLLPAEPTAPAAEQRSASRAAEPPPPAEPPAAAETPAPPPPAPAPAREPSMPASPSQMPLDALAFPPAATSPPIPAAPVPAAPQPQPRGEAEVSKAEDDAGPRALALVDLNTASVADLNRLQGGGAIGRAIVSKRPYTSVDQLMSKRVLSRAIYDRIREQVTVR